MHSLLSLTLQGPVVVQTLCALVVHYTQVHQPLKVLLLAWTQARSQLGPSLHTGALSALVPGLTDCRLRVLC